ncbi:MAG TPA: sigma-54 dependent transcriptional regulator [Bryobacteraceae bacterium]|nr:sigma-54 dependent transcriptional regulator [Bryobacteraceae bacterium]
MTAVGGMEGSKKVPSFACARGIEPEEQAPRPQSYLGLSAIIASQPMQKLMELVVKVAQTSATVLIAGESGSGKELVARAIHHYSLRCTKPWVDLNCGALPEHLIESELFGYEKGAFSGAESMKPGLFEAANSGTLFLDEIGELDIKTQVKLLRVLDGVPYYRLGGTRKVMVDVRVVAATNVELEEAIQGGRFRPDLYHRLSPIQIQVPALRQRLEDVGPLANFFLQQQDPRRRFTREAIEVLQRYSWPGNVRELRNVVTRATIYSSVEEIGAADLPDELAGKMIRPAAPDGAGTYSLDGLEQHTIFKVLEQTGGHQQKAADILGISRRTLIRKLKLYRNVPCQSVA